MATYVAVDLGASAGRVVSGAIDDSRLRVEVVHRFPNEAIQRSGHLRWDIRQLYAEIRTGLARVRDPASIGIDTWGVDYALLDDQGTLIDDPIAYRDNRTAEVLDDVHGLVPPKELYAINGLQVLPFNTIYQLVAEQRGKSWERAARVVLLPDLLSYWLTGELRTELTNASTTGLLDARTHQWADGLLDRLGIPADLLPPLETPGSIRGTAEGSSSPVVTVGSHDTASAVVGVPAITDRFAYVSSGTWSLVGLELPRPVLTEAARSANFANELGVDGRTRFLRNVGGLWLLQECLRDWGHGDLDLLLSRAAELPHGGPRIEVDDPGLLAHGDMPARIARAAGHCELTAPETVRCIVDSLASAYARTIEQAAELAGQAVEVVHVVGGGAQNRLLCQLTADACGLPVVAGPVEATAIGNLALQARATGALPGSLEAIRARLAASTPLVRYDPS
jgi:rhamnulokinase